MLDSPSFQLFCRKFHSEEACAEALFQARWPDGFRCPVCGRSSFYRIRTRRLPLYECRSCRHQTSVTAGTILEKSTTPLTKWFQAIFLIAQPDGISATRLSQILQVTYKTAWLIARKIRRALQKADERDPLAGVVHIYHFRYGYDDYLDAGQPLIAGVSLDGSLQEVRQVKIKQPHPDHVVNGFKRRVEKPGVKSFIQNHLHPRAISLVYPYRRPRILMQMGRQVGEWLNRTFCGIGPKHLQAYLDEFCFRLNCGYRGIGAFGPVVEWCARTSAATYRELTRSKPVLPAPWLAWGSKAKWKGYHLSLWAE